jgi:hypothetical protein
MAKMKDNLILLIFLLAAVSVQANVHVYVQDTNGVAWIKYECTADEVIRAFALNVTVDRGHIIGISNFLAGPSTTGAQGYGIFPSSFRDHITVVSGSNVNWNVSTYTPVATVADSPGDTLPGLNSSGVTLELGALWNTTVPTAIPSSPGTLCALHLSRPAKVSVAANLSRGGIVLAAPDIIIAPMFTGALVGPAITNATVVGGDITIHFQGGELETATAVDGTWTGTGSTNGLYTEPVGAAQSKFFRVHQH